MKFFTADYADITDLEEACTAIRKIYPCYPRNPWLRKSTVHVNDLHATMLHVLGIDHERLSIRSQGRDFRLTDVAGKVVNGILA